MYKKKKEKKKRKMRVMKLKGRERDTGGVRGGEKKYSPYFPGMGNLGVAFTIKRYYYVTGVIRATPPTFEPASCKVPPRKKGDSGGGLVFIGLIKVVARAIKVGS